MLKLRKRCAEEDTRFKNKMIVKDKRMKNKRIYLMLLVTVLLLMGCEKKVVTVAGAESEEQAEEVVNYIEIEKFQLKEPEEEYEGEEVLFCAVLIPEGYHEAEDVPGMYIHERYPFEASNIYYSASDGLTEGIISKELTKELYEKLLEEAFLAEGETVDIEIESFKQVEMEGVPVYEVRSSYAKDAKRVLQLTYLVLAERTHVITYTQMSDDEMMTDFAAAEGQVKLVTTKE